MFLKASGSLAQWTTTVGNLTGHLESLWGYRRLASNIHTTGAVA